MARKGQRNMKVSVQETGPISGKHSRYLQNTLLGRESFAGEQYKRTSV
jgi:hypothetical protein